MSLSPYNPEDEEAYTLGTGPACRVERAWSTILKKPYTIRNRKRAFLQAGHAVTTVPMNCATRVASPGVLVLKGHPVAIAVGQGSAVVDLHESWSALTDLYARKYEVMFVFADGAVHFAMQSGTVHFAANALATVAVRLQPLIHATIMPNADVRALKVMPGSQVWARRYTAGAMLTVHFHPTTGYVCAACGHVTKTLAAAVEHGGGGQAGKYMRVAPEATSAPQQPPKPRAAVVPCYEYTTLRHSVLLRKLGEYLNQTARGSR